MKTLLFILLLTTEIFASLSTIERDYELLNAYIDKISINLEVEQKLPLYHLTLLTHEKIIISLSSDKIKINAIKDIENETLKLISTLERENRNINKNDIKNLKELYKKINQEAYVEIRSKINESDSTLSFTLFMISIGIALGLLIGFFVFKEPLKKEIEDIKVKT